jgi:hypothetical protein
VWSPSCTRGRPRGRCRYRCSRCGAAVVALQDGGGGIALRRWRLARSAERGSCQSPPPQPARDHETKRIEEKQRPCARFHLPGVAPSRTRRLSFQRRETSVHEDSMHFHKDNFRARSAQKSVQSPLIRAGGTVSAVAVRVHAPAP